METVLLILLLIAASAANIACFIIGARVGQKVVRGERVELPSVNIPSAVRARENKKHADAEQKRINTIMENLERYDGTPRGQKDVPGGSA